MDSVAVIEVWGKQKDSSQKGGATLGADTKQLMAREKSNLVCHYNLSKCKLGTWFTNVNYLVYMCCKCNKWVTLCLIESKIDACKLFDAWVIFMNEIVPKSMFVWMLHVLEFLFLYLCMKRCTNLSFFQCMCIVQWL